MPDEVVIDARYNGPPDSANGGYACGVVAAPIGAAARVDLRAPPPLDRGLRRERDDAGRVRLLSGDTLVAEGVADTTPLRSPEPPLHEQAEEAGRRAPWRDPANHAFPTCFVCGPLRERDGLCIFPGPLDDAGLVACAWTPAPDLAADDGTVDPLVVWSALDCPSGFACIPPETMTVLASMTARLEAPVRAGQRCVVTGWPLSSEGRKHRAGSAIHDASGRRLAVAEALWITIGPR